MAGFFENLKLGAAGALDLATGALNTVTGGFVPASHEAATVYAEQTSEDTAAAEGLSDTDQAELEAKLAAAATSAEDKGAVRQAAADTVDQVADKVTSAFSFGKYAIAAAVIVAGVVLVVRVTPSKAKS